MRPPHGKIPTSWSLPPQHLDAGIKGQMEPVTSGPRLNWSWHPTAGTAGLVLDVFIGVPHPRFGYTRAPFQVLWLFGLHQTWSCWSVIFTGYIGAAGLYHYFFGFRLMVFMLLKLNKWLDTTHSGILLLMLRGTALYSYMYRSCALSVW